MKLRGILFVSFVLIAGQFLVQKGYADDGIDLNVKWKDGLKFESADKTVQIQLGGRILNDWAVFLSSDDQLKTSVGKLEDGTEFRRARLYLAGTINEKLEFKAQYDFAQGDADFKDVYLGLKKVPVVGNIRVGQFDEPFSLEEITSSNVGTFMERGLSNAFVPSRNTGLMLFNAVADNRATWGIGFFRDSDDYGDNQSQDNALNYTARATVLPVWSDDSSRVVHLGVSYSFRNPNHDSFRFRERPEIHLAPRFVDTKEFAADSGNFVGAELAVVMDRFSVQGEYVEAAVNAKEGSDPSFSSFYLQASCFLTGEHRMYDPAKAVFSRVKPKDSFIKSGKDWGTGAVELAARYSYLDLNDGAIMGGKLSDVTVGLNWYLHANSRVMLNYVMADVDNVGDANILGTRFQLDF